MRLLAVLHGAWLRSWSRVCSRCFCDVGSASPGLPIPSSCRTTESIGPHGENSLRSQHALPGEGALHGRGKGREHPLCPAVEGNFSWFLFLCRSGESSTGQLIARRQVNSGCKLKQKRLLLLLARLLRHGAAQKQPPKRHGSDSLR